MKIALNLDLTLSDDGKCLALLISCGIIDLGAFCVELRPFYWSERMLVPMSYITFFENLAVLVPYMSYIVYFHKLSNYMGKR